MSTLVRTLVALGIYWVYIIIVALLGREIDSGTASVGAAVVLAVAFLTDKENQ